MKKIKIQFNKLIGDHYSIDIKMEVLNWMLKTGKPFIHSYGWYKDGINKSLFAYSANNHDNINSILPFDQIDYFDAIFARAIYKLPNKPLKEWRKNENIYPDKYRMLSFNNTTFDSVSSLIYRINLFNGKILKKEYHHPEKIDRTEPKIIKLQLFTLGNGWVLKYAFSFKEFDYEMGWEKEFIQNIDESIYFFLKRVEKELTNLIVV